MAQDDSVQPFDPYDSWFQIPPAEQPPDHYRLLGLSRFENRQQTILDAYNLRMKIVNYHSNKGPHKASAHRLIKELHAAGKLLRDDKARAEYDQTLTRKDSLPDVVAVGPPVISVDTAKTETIQTPAAKRSGSRRPKKSPLRLGIETVLGGLVAIPLTLLLLNYVFHIDPFGPRKLANAPTAPIASAPSKEEKAKPRATAEPSPAPPDLPDSTVQTNSSLQQPVTQPEPIVTITPAAQSEAIAIAEAAPPSRVADDKRPDLPTSPQSVAIEQTVAATASSEAPVPPQNPSAPAAEVKKPTSDEPVALDRMKEHIENHEKQLAAAKAAMLKNFDLAARKVRAAKNWGGSDRLAMLQRLKEERAAFDQLGYVPFSEPMRIPWFDYVSKRNRADYALAQAFDDQIAAFIKANDDPSAALLAKEKESRLAPRIVSRWRVTSGNGIWDLYSDGFANPPPRTAPWKLTGDVLTVVWTDSRTSKKNIDTCALNALGNHFEAKNQTGFSFTGDAIQPAIKIPLEEIKEDPALKWTQLFNGKDLSGWKKHSADRSSWTVEDGALVGSGYGYLFCDRNTYSNFRVRVEAMISDRGNSGLFFRAQFGKAPTGHGVEGYESNINSTGPGDKTGSLFLFLSPQNISASVAANADPPKPNQWFSLEIVAKDDFFTVHSDGKHLLNWRDPQRSYSSGHIALQSLDGIVRFRKVEIIDLNATR